jgi:ferredoxin, 2Fe-2S
MYTVKFSYEQEGLATVAFEQVEPGQTLLEFALRKDIELHHNCGGVCSCTTCHLYVDRGMEHIDVMEQREKDFVQRARNPKPHSRLGCQSLLLEGSGEIAITIPDQRSLPDEYYDE